MNEAQQPSFEQPPVVEAHSQDMQSPHHVRVLVIIVLVLVVLLASIVGVWWFLYRQPSLGDDTLPPASVDGTTEQNNELMLPILEDTKNDKDKDGIIDVEEETMGTSDTDFDTDGDGLSDKSEVDIWKTNPTNSDTDGDSFNDGVEVFNGYNPAGEGTI